MLNFKIVPAIANSVKGWLEFFMVQKKELELREMSAVKAYYTAVNETRLYLNQLKRSKSIPFFKGKRRNKEVEMKLSRLWTQASYTVAPFSGYLANLCFVKGDYWTEPGKWSKNDVKIKRIEIERMYNDARKIIKTD